MARRRFHRRKRGRRRDHEQRAGLVGRRPVRSRVARPREVSGRAPRPSVMAPHTDLPSSRAWVRGGAPGGHGTGRGQVRRRHRREAPGSPAVTNRFPPSGVHSPSFAAPTGLGLGQGGSVRLGPRVEGRRFSVQRSPSGGGRPGREGSSRARSRWASGWRGGRRGGRLSAAPRAGRPPGSPCPSLVTA